MGAIDFLFWILAIAAPLSAGAGLAVIALSPAEFRAARYLFIGAGILALAAIILWGSTTDVSFPVRAVIVSLLAAILSLATVESVRWVLKREDLSKEAPPPGLPNTATAYFDCVFGWWPEADKDTQAFNVALTQFGLAEPIVGIGSGPTVPHNHEQKFSSGAPLKCDITFYGDKPLFNIEIPIAIDLYETIRESKRNSSGRFLKTLNAPPVLIKQVSFPDNNHVRFYVYSFDVDAYIGVRIPKEFRYKTLDSDDQRTGRFITSGNPMMLAGPTPTASP